MSIQTIVAAAEPPERSQPALFAGPRPVRPARPATTSPAAQRPNGGATTYRWRANFLNVECQTCRTAFEAALKASVAWAELPPRPACARQTRDMRVGNVVMTSEHFCTPHAYQAGFKGRA